MQYCGITLAHYIKESGIKDRNREGEGEGEGEDEGVRGWVKYRDCVDKIRGYFRQVLTIMR